MWSELRYQHLATTMSKVGDEFKKIQQEAKEIRTSMKVTKTGEFLKKKASTSGHHCLIEDIGYVSYPPVVLSNGTRISKVLELVPFLMGLEQN